MSPSSPRARATLRWGGAIAALLVIQSLVLAAIFWLLATENHIHDAETGFRGDCREFGLMEKGERMEELRQALDRDVHRDRFLALFDADGMLLEGNVARLPPGPLPAGSAIATIRPTELPGVARDEVRYAVCAFRDGTRLFTALDLDDSQYAIRVVERSVLIGLVPGLMLAVGAGLVAGRRAARQVDAVSALTRKIMAGDLRERLPVRNDPPDSFGLLCANINTMLDRLQALVAEVRGVGDDIAHQLRTPVTRLRARVERGLRDAVDRSGFASAGEAALADIDKLLGVVAALLRIRELEDHARRSRFAPVDLARLAEDACDLHRPAVEEEGGSLVCSIVPVGAVEGDASLLIEAISNLVDNALKFGPSGGAVTLTLAAERGEPVLTVADEGPGIPAAERRFATQRFWRGRRDCDGVGLGLSLVKAIADLHGCALRFAADRSAVSLIFEGGK